MHHPSTCLHIQTPTPCGAPPSRTIARAHTTHTHTHTHTPSHLAMPHPHTRTLTHTHTHTNTPTYTPGEALSHDTKMWANNVSRNSSRSMLSCDCTSPIYTCRYTHIHKYVRIHPSAEARSPATVPTLFTNIDIYILIERTPPPGGVSYYYVPSSRTVCTRTPLEGFVPGSSRGALLHTILDEGT